MKMEKDKRINEYSVLMPLWYKEEPDYLKLSLESMLNQTIKPQEIVMIADYEIPPVLLNLVKDLKAKYSLTEIKIIYNFSLAGKGLGAVLRFGVTCCKNEIIARMDSDDIADIGRCSEELQILIENEDIAIVGGGIAKFDTSTGRACGFRTPPESGQRLNRYAKFRCPFNHPTVMFRKSAVIVAGNYPELQLCEDYDLWYRMFLAGYKGYNLQSVVLYYRAGTDGLLRRKNKNFYKAYLNLIDSMKKRGYLTWGEALLSKGVQTIRYYCPFFVIKKLDRFL